MSIQYSASVWYMTYIKQCIHSISDQAYDRIDCLSHYVSYMSREGLSVFTSLLCWRSSSQAVKQIVDEAITRSTENNIIRPTTIGSCIDGWKCLVRYTYVFNYRGWVSRSEVASVTQFRLRYTLLAHTKLYTIMLRIVPFTNAVSIFHAVLNTILHSLMIFHIHQTFHSIMWNDPSVSITYNCLRVWRCGWCDFHISMNFNVLINRNSDYTISIQSKVIYCAYTNILLPL